MKILLFFTFFLISGPVSCFDVIGYFGGDVMIHCTIPRGTNRGYNMYFCKESANQCVYPKSDSSPNSWDHKGRVSLQESDGFLTVIYRDLTLEDTGLYLCGGTGLWSDTVKLNVKTDNCCSGPKNVIGYLSKHLSISCFYPEEFEDNAKFFYKLNGVDYTEKARTSDLSRSRFSISDDRRLKVVSMNISDVREDDEGVYYCGASKDGGASNYETFFTKIHLQITEFKITPAPPAPITPTSTAEPTPATSTGVTTSAPDSPVANSLSIILALLLIGGAVLIFFIVILKKRKGSTPLVRTNRCDHKEVPAVVNNDEETGLTTLTPPKEQEITYSTLTPPKDQEITDSTPTPPKDQELTYSTVSFHKNPGSSTDASVRVSKEEPETEYATIKRPK